MQTHEVDQTIMFFFVAKKKKTREIPQKPWLIYYFTFQWCCGESQWLNMFFSMKKTPQPHILLTIKNDIPITYRPKSN